MNTNSLFINLNYFVIQILLILFFATPFAGSAYISLRRWRERNGPELVTIGKYKSKIIRYIGLFFALVAFFSLFRQDFGLQTIVNFAFWGLIAVSLLRSASNDIYVLKNGISTYHLRRTHWEQLSIYLWDDQDENRLFLFKKGGGKIELTVPPGKRTVVNQLLQTKLKNASTP